MTRVVQYVQPIVQVSLPALGLKTQKGGGNARTLNLRYYVSWQPERSYDISLETQPAGSNWSDKHSSFCSFCLLPCSLLGLNHPETGGKIILLRPALGTEQVKNGR